MASTDPLPNLSPNKDRDKETRSSSSDSSSGGTTNTPKEKSHTSKSSSSSKSGKSSSKSSKSDTPEKSRKRQHPEKEMTTRKASTSTSAASTSISPLEDSDEGPPSKQPKVVVVFEPIKLTSISNLEDMDLKIILFQVEKLKERLEFRQKEETDLRQRIEQLEKRQTQDDAVLNVINRYWNQLNEDIRIALQRFDTETSDETESNNENKVTSLFLSEMEELDKKELDEKLAKKVQVSTRAVTKIVQAFDRLMQRSSKLSEFLQTVLENDANPNLRAFKLSPEARQKIIDVLEISKSLHLKNTNLHAKYRTIALKYKELKEKSMAMETEGDELNNRVADMEFEYGELQSRNRKLLLQVQDYHEKVKRLKEVHGDNSESSSDIMTSGEVLSLEKENEEQRELVENRQKELDSLKQKHIQTLMEIDKLNQEIQHLPEQTVMETTEYKCLQSKFSVIYSESCSLRQAIQDVKKNLFSVNSSQQKQIEEMENEERLCQKKLQSEMVHLEDTLNQVKKEYEMLRLEFEKNAAANEQVAPVHREMRNLITQLQQHNQQIKAEGQKFRVKCSDVQKDNLKVKKGNAELIQKLEKLQIAKKEGKICEPSHKEKKVPKTKTVKTPALKAEKEKVESKPDSEKEKEIAPPGPPPLPGIEPPVAEVPAIKEDNVKKETKEEVVTATEEKSAEASSSDMQVVPVSTSTAASTSTSTTPEELKDVKVKTDPATALTVAVPAASPTVTFAIPTSAPSHPPPKQKLSEAEQATISDLKSQLKKYLAEQKEMKLLLDMYKGQNKEQTDRVELMVNERKARLELEELKAELKKQQENQKKEEKKKVAEEDLSAKIRVLEERTNSLRRQISAQKQEEEALLNEMDVTGQAFEDMQEQNSRLIQQLREKENANFKLMSDRIKSNRVQELLKEEKDMQQTNNETLMRHLDAKNVVIRKLEEIEQQLVSTIAVMEKEAMMRQQAMEMNKRKAIESAQSAADLKLHLEKYHSQMKEAQQLVAEKTSSLAAEAYKTKRYQEEVIILTKKLERLKKIEMTGSTDEVVLAEIQEYKEMLTCPSCKVRRKDAVLTKCFHVFCFDCLRTRYETRQRKCPRCNAAFGANDYHRLYLS